MGWGTHEKALPPDGARHSFGCDAAIYLNRPGLLTRVRTWTPLEGPFHGFIITHNESISMADYFTAARRQEGRLPADRALRLSPVRPGDHVDARDRREEPASSRSASG